MTNKVTLSRADEALFKFDVDNNVEPFRTIAERIMRRHDLTSPAWSTLVDEIAHALEDAYNIGEKRGPLVEAAKTK